MTKKTGESTGTLCPAGFVVVRAPLLPLDELRAFGQGLRCSSDGSVADAGMLSADRDLLRRRLRDLVDRRVVAEAIYVASPSLSRQIDTWRADPETRDAAKAESALVRYFARMAGRATPFGLFATFGLGVVGERTELKMSPRDVVRRHVRLDMEFVVELAARLDAEPALRSRIAYRTNPSMYEVAGRLHVPVLRRRGERRAYELVAVEPEPAVRLVLAAARDGATRADLARLVEREHAETSENALAFVDELIEAGALASTLTPAITGDDPLASLVKSLRSAVPDEPPEATRVLEDVAQRLVTLNETPAGASPALYEAIAERLGALDVPVDPAHLFQVDASRGGQFVLDAVTVEAIARGVRALHAFAPPNDDLRTFTKELAARYETREVPLMEALDEEVGIGFGANAEAAEPAPLLAGLDLDPRREDASRLAWTAREQLLLRKLEEAWSSGVNAIALTEEDLAPLTAMPHSPLPRSLAALVTVLGQGRVWLQHFTGGSGARLLGRFSAWSPLLADHLRAHLRDEEADRPDAIFAEIAHLPSRTRHGNILFRPLLRPHEIAFCGTSGASAENVFHVDDLWITVRQGRIRLRSRSTGKEVVPRLSSAHSVGARETGVYRFLYALQGQDQTQSGAFSWGPFAGAKRLPRVEVGGVILSPCSYRIDRHELARFAASTSIERFRAAARLREALSLPRWVGLRDGDNVLPVDLDNTLSVDAFASVVKRRETVRITELYYGEDDIVLRGPEGGYVNEVLVPFVHVRPAVREPREPPPAASGTGRRFAPGSEWLFAKVYCARGTIDEVLRSAVRPFLAEALGTVANGWFFLRYADPEPHLRLRIHGPAGRVAGALPMLERALCTHLASGRVHRLELATYDREVERYGGPRGIEIAERIFQVDSEAALSMIELLGGRPEGRDRWACALYGTHRMFDDFRVPLDARIASAQLVRASVRRELQLSAESDRAVLDRFRKDRASVAAICEGDVPAGARDILDGRSAALAPLFAELHSAGLDRGLALLTSYVHMWNNRVLRSRARAHEMVLSTFLLKHYESLRARSNKPPFTPP